MSFILMLGCILFCFHYNCEFSSFETFCSILEYAKRIHTYAGKGRCEENSIQETILLDGVPGLQNHSLRTRVPAAVSLVLSDGCFSGQGDVIVGQVNSRIIFIVKIINY